MKDISARNDGERRGLIIGRYQVLHNGHLNIFKYIDSQPDVDEIIIGIGSSQYNRRNKNFEMPWITNPFTYEERAAMVSEALKGEISKPVQIIPILDQHDCERWVKYVMSIMPHFNYFYSNSKTEKEHFQGIGVEIRGIPIKDSFHAQTIREMMALGERYDEFVPPGVTRFMKSINGEQMLSDFFQEHGEEIIEAHKFFPDWEWRTFDQLSKDEKIRLDSLDTILEKRFSDNYLIIPGRPDLNVKLRNEIIKVKRTLNKEEGLLQTATYSFRDPVKRKAAEALFKDIGMALAGDSKEAYRLAELISQIKENAGDARIMTVGKERIVKAYDSCGIDIQKITLTDSSGKPADAYSTVGIESRSKNKIWAAVSALGLRTHKTMDYNNFLVQKSGGE